MPDEQKRVPIIQKYKFWYNKVSSIKCSKMLLKSNTSSSSGSAPAAHMRSPFLGKYSQGAHYSQNSGLVI